jgi:hypothetical protein
MLYIKLGKVMAQYSEVLFCGIGVRTQGLHLEPLHQPFFVMSAFKIGSHKLFAQTGFEY